MRFMTFSAFSASLNLRFSSIVPTSLTKSLKLGTLLRREHLLDSDPSTPTEGLVSPAKPSEFWSLIFFIALTFHLEIVQYIYHKKNDINKYILRRSIIIFYSFFFFFNSIKGHVRWRLLAEYIDFWDIVWPLSKTIFRIHF